MSLPCCAGSDVADLSYVVQYVLPQSPVYPAGTIRVSPPEGRMRISEEGAVRVELKLAGAPVQSLDEPNFGPKYKAQLLYVFGLPQALAPDSRACADVEVIVTSVKGVAVPDFFRLCAGTEFTRAVRGG